MCLNVDFKHDLLAKQFEHALVNVYALHIDFRKLFPKHET